MPSALFQVSIQGLKTISECANIELSAALVSTSLYPIYFSWDISFSTVGANMTDSILASAKEYFKTYLDFTTASIISIPEKYYTSGSELKVVLTAQTREGLGKTSTSTTVKIVESFPSAKFACKTQAVQNFPWRYTYSCQHTNRKQKMFRWNYNSYKYYFFTLFWIFYNTNYKRR